MAATLLELAKQGDLNTFESRCLELLEAGELSLTALAASFEHLASAGQGPRAATLAQMVLENANLTADPRGGLAFACAVLNLTPENAALRKTVADLYRAVHGQTPGFDAILASSGLIAGAAARAALRVLDFCLTLAVGDTLISRMDDRVVEVVAVDRDRGLFTLRQRDRTTTTPAREVVREYERVDPNDFRVLRQLHPERLPELVQNDPVALVIGLIQAHGGLIDADQLKHELVPKLIASGEWSKWWTRTRTQLKRSPHVVIEGRAPVVLSYSAAGVTLEEETWSAVATDEPMQWLRATEAYLSEAKARGAGPDAGLLQRIAEHAVQHIERIRRRRPSEALAGALVLGRLGQKGLPVDDARRGLAGAILAEAKQPADLFAHLKEDVLWERALDELPQARQDWAERLTELTSVTPATWLDRLAALARQANRLEVVQGLVDDALADPIDYAEVLYWLWKGPEDAGGLKLPRDAELFASILETLGALGVTLHPSADVTRHFKARIKAALGLRDYGRVRTHLQQTSQAAAVPLRRQIERLDGLGEVARGKLLEILRETHPELWVQQIQKVEPWEDPNTIWATQAGLDRKTAERDELVNVKMPENAKRIGEAASHGDLSENSEYRFALEERDFLRARLAQLNHDLSLARVLDVHDVPIAYVGIGTRITLRHVADGHTRVMTLLGPFETNVEEGVFNYKAPACQKLLGGRVGERRSLTIDGQDQEFEIVACDHGLAGVEAHAAHG